MTQYVFVLDQNKQPLMPCCPARARQMLKAGKAAVFKRQPFTIILKNRTGGNTQPVEVKLDPGSKQTGIVLAVQGKHGKQMVWAATIVHRGQTVKDNLLVRRQQRRARRNRNTRYRAARFLNRRGKVGCLPPSLESRVNNMITWVKRLMKAAPVTSIGQELVRFDTQALQNPEISGVEYQQGTLMGYEVREYLLEKWDRTCAYCGKTDTPLEIEHIIPRARGGSDRVSNLTLACHACNQAKGTQTAAEFGHPGIQARARLPLKDAAAVNTTRWALYNHLTQTGLPVSISTGGRTKFNRVTQGYPKAHWIDAACVGESGESVWIDPKHRPLTITAMGRQRRQMTLVDKYGFPRSKSKGTSRVNGFQTGDLVEATVPSGKRQGHHVGRVAVKTSGNFTIDSTTDIPWRYCRKLQASDGYRYKTGAVVSPVA